MITDNLSVLCSYILAISLANERLVSLIKTFIPWLSQEPLDSNGLVDQKRERWRTIILQLISFTCALITTILLKTSDSFNICIGDKTSTCLPFWVVALLSTSGGSAFWSSLLGYVNAVKDIKKQERAIQRLALAARAKSLAIPVHQISTL